MQSILNVQDGQEVASEYDLPGTRYWLVRTGLQDFAVFGWVYDGWGKWVIGQYPRLTKVFDACMGGPLLTAVRMVDGGRAVISAVHREAS